MLAFCLQWELEGRQMQAGDVIVQQVYLPPIRALSCNLVVGVRIIEVFDSDQRMGFRYGTLRGHVETGVAEFDVKLIDGQFVFTIHTFSRPGHWLSRLVGPFFTEPYQNYVTRKAVGNMQAMFARENSEITGVDWQSASGI